MIDFLCHSCEAELTVEGDAAGAVAACPDCRVPLVVPESAGAASRPVAETEAQSQPPESVSQLLREVQPPLHNLLPEGERYAAPELVGQGGMGAVMRVNDRRLRRTVAMKLIRDQGLHDRKAVLRFLEEAQITGQLQHPGIVPIHDIGQDEKGRPYYTMKLLQGRTLQEIIDPLRAGDSDTLRDWPLARRLSIFERVCEAVAYAHSHGVVHRDLKPENIMVGEFGEVQVLDWGLAKVLEGEEEEREETEGPLDSDGAEMPLVVSRRNDPGSSLLLSRDGHIMGTPSYMAPEQASGRVRDIDARSDVYGLGAVLYELVHLRRPIEGDTVMQLLHRTRSGAINFPKTSRPGLDAILRKALALKRKARYANAGELQRDVEQHLQGFATEAEEAGAWRLLRLFYQRHRAMVATVFGSTLLLLSLAIASVLVNRAARLEAERARGEAEENLVALKDEQARRVGDRKTSAPALVNLGRNLMRQSRFEDAYNVLQTAHDYDPEHEGLPLLLCGTLTARGQFPEALDLARGLPGTHPDKAKLIQLTKGMLAADPLDQPIGRLSALWMKLDLPEVAGTITRDPDERLKTWREKLRQAWKIGDPQLTINEQEGGLFLRHEYDRNSPDYPLCLDLSPLEGIPLRSLDIRSSPVSDLSPLTSQTHLKRLVLVGTRVSDLSPLEKLPLEFLRIEGRGGPRLESLAPLAKLPLAHLILDTRDASLSRLKHELDLLSGLRLERCMLYEAPDLKFLHNSRLTHLHLNHCGGDHSALSNSVATLVSYRVNRPQTIAPLAGAHLKWLHLLDVRFWNIEELNLVQSENIEIDSPYFGLSLDCVDFREFQSLKIGSVVQWSWLHLGGALDERLDSSIRLFIPAERKISLKHSLIDRRLLRQQFEEVDEILGNMAWNIEQRENLARAAPALEELRAECERVRVEGWIEAMEVYEGHTYAVCIPANPTVIESFARQIGATLAKFESDDELAFVNQTLCSQVSNAKKTKIYVGLRRRPDQVWVWHDDTPLGSMGGFPNSPAKTGGNRAVLNGRTGRFENVYSWYRYRFLLEWPELLSRKEIEERARQAR